MALCCWLGIGFAWLGTAQSAGDAPSFLDGVDTVYDREPDHFSLAARPVNFRRASFARVADPEMYAQVV